jgi:predicted CxxxxCH...CXXCH cytochrome family protein
MTGDDCLGIHGCGVLDPMSDDFHGRVLARHDWDFGLCATCHSGEAVAAAPSCTTCHTDGPTACVTCHRDGPRTGAHATHVTASVACDACHRVPATWDADGHILVDGRNDPLPAEVTMETLAAATPRAADRNGPPMFDPATGTCAQVYCHGDVLGGAGGDNPQPRWIDPPSGPPRCTGCHGQPPPSTSPWQ